MVGFVWIIVVGGVLWGGGPLGTVRGQIAASATVATISDNQQIQTVMGSVTYVLSDSILTGSLGVGVRSYEILLRTNLPLGSDLVNLSTSSVTQWAGPNQVPGGPDNLPSLSYWSWTVYRGTVNDTANWTISLSGGVLHRPTPWQNATFAVQGVPRVQVDVSVTPGLDSGAVATEPGWVMSTQVPQKDPNFIALATSLNPGVIRLSQTYLAPATWENASGTVSFDLAQFSAEMNFTSAVGANTYVSFPAGTWGDGNLLPSGMPLNTSLLVNWWNHGTGYFPTLAAYSTYLKTFATDVKSHGWTITYWNIGNEVPVGFDLTQSYAFATLFNTAAQAIHSVLPKALVGSDVFTWPTRVKLFATHVVGAGFLAVHVYPATKLCSNPNEYCPPDNVSGYLTDSQVFARSDNFLNDPWTVSPRSAQEQWYNLTGHWLPLIDAETNLNSAQNQGTDPRIPTLFDAAWLVSQLIDASNQNISSLLYYSLSEMWPPASSPTEEYGGWGFGLTAQGSSNSNLEFAAYWALKLWASSVPLGARELSASDSLPNYVRAFAVGSGSNFSVILANRLGVAVTIPVGSTNSSWVAHQVTKLDSSTYKLEYNAANQTAWLASSGISHPAASGKSTTNVVLNGYGVAVVTFRDPSTSNGSGGGNGSGNGTGNSTGGGGGNTTGNSTGNSTGGSGSGGSGNSTGNSTGGSGSGGNSTGNSTAGSGSGGGNSTGAGGGGPPGGGSGTTGPPPTQSTNRPVSPGSGPPNVLEWLSFGFAASMVTSGTLLALRLALAVGLVVALAVVARSLRWGGRHLDPRASKARIVRVAGSLPKGYSPPPVATWASASGGIVGQSNTTYRSR